MNSFRNTYGSIKNQVGPVINMCGDNPDLMRIVNEGAKLLFDEGDWIGKTQIYRMLASVDEHRNRILTWPYFVETVEALQRCGVPIGVRNTAFEFISNATGTLDRIDNWAGTNYGYGRWWTGALLGDRGEVPSHMDIRPSNKKIRVYPHVFGDTGKFIFLYGYDDNGQWIRTVQDGVMADGEKIELGISSPPKQTVNFYSKLTGVQFSETPRESFVTITEYDTVTTLERFLSQYQYNEEFPSYRRSILAGFCRATDQEFEDEETDFWLTAFVRLRYIPVQSDRDYLQVGNVSALKDIVLSLQKRDNGKLAEAAEYQARATRVLQNELKNYQGYAPKKAVSWQKRQAWGAGCNIQ